MIAFIKLYLWTLFLLAMFSFVMAAPLWGLMYIGSYAFGLPFVAYYVVGDSLLFLSWLWVSFLFLRYVGTDLGSGIVKLVDNGLL